MPILDNHIEKSKISLFILEAFSKTIVFDFPRISTHFLVSKHSVYLFSVIKSA